MAGRSTDIVIASAARTPIGAFNGAFASLKAHELGTIAVVEAMKRAGISPSDVNEVILGQVLTAGNGMNPARQTAMAAGIPQERTAFVINQVCGSGLRTVALAAQAIMVGDAKIMVAGGQESMSNSPHCMHLRNGTKMGNAELIDTLINDGLWDVFNGYHMGVTAENVAQQYQISRDAQDAFAAASQQKAGAAQKAGKFKDEILALEIPQKKGAALAFDADEYPKHGTTVESLGALRPAFDKNGTVTAGNASGINDGAAAVIMMSAKKADELGLKPLARIKAYSSAGVNPKIMGMGPVPASRLCLSKAGWSAKDLDLMEINEAFAAQAIAVNKEMGWDTSKINVNGGAIAIGHPIGASGCRILVTLIHEMIRRDAKKGLAALCIGGGMGVALAIER